MPEERPAAPRYGQAPQHRRANHDGANKSDKDAGKLCVVFIAREKWATMTRCIPKWTQARLVLRCPKQSAFVRYIIEQAHAAKASHTLGLRGIHCPISRITRCNVRQHANPHHDCQGGDSLNPQRQW
jgi:hypothetical protein